MSPLLSLSFSLWSLPFLLLDLSCCFLIIYNKENFKRRILHSNRRIYKLSFGYQIRVFQILDLQVDLLYEGFLVDIFELHAFVLSSTNNGLSISSAYAGDSLKIKKKLKKKTQPDIFSLQFFLGGGGCFWF